ncbi:MAG TPA: diacylglycerol kinase family protein [Spirochaetia bacterium]|nr:diacylglycerol kinase family protein [Spirochaetia bacterium]
MDLKQIREFFDSIVHLLAYSQRLSTTPYQVDVIVNPVAGRVARHHILTHELAVVRSFLDRLRTIYPNHNPHDVLPAANTMLHISERPGNAALITRNIIDSMLPTGGAALAADAPRRLLVSVGGDGTHEEVLSVLYQADPSVLQRLEIFRLPMGTGNDAADAGEVQEACELLYGGENSRRISALRVQATGLDPFFSFNIASMGLDAFVTDVTNRLRGVVPGDTYKAIADVATLFYEPTFRRGPMEIRIESPEGSQETLSGRFVLLAMGVSGHRVYGGAKPVLPGDENLCIVSSVSVIRKIQLKKLFYSGTHVDQPETTMRKARRIVVQYDGKIPVQVDGESRWLHPEHFPVSIEILEPRVHVLTHPKVTESRRIDSESRSPQNRAL